MFNTQSIVSNFEVNQLKLLFQLSQFEDSRREDRDLSSSSQVRLQHLWCHWRRGSHYQVWLECSPIWSLYCYMTGVSIIFKNRVFYKVERLRGLSFSVWLDAVFHKMHVVFYKSAHFMYVWTVFLPNVISNPAKY